MHLVLLVVTHTPSPFPFSPPTPLVYSPPTPPTHTTHYTLHTLHTTRQPAPSRWLPLRGPSCFMPERAAATNMARLTGALQALQDEAAAAGGGIVGLGGGLGGRGGVGRGGGTAAAGQQSVIALAGQLVHAGRQDRAAQVRERGRGFRLVCPCFVSCLVSAAPTNCGGRLSVC